MKTEPTIETKFETIAHADRLTLKFEGENWGDGRGALDTKVSITAGTMLWISWPEREKFINELKAVIDKYAI